MKKKYVILISLILIVVFLFFCIVINKYFDVYKPLKSYYLTAYISAENKAYVYDLGKMKGEFVENSYYTNVVMVTRYKNEENYIAFVENEGGFYLIEFVNGKVNNSIILPNQIDKLSVWENKVVFLMENIIYVADFNTSSYNELLTTVDNTKIQESFFVFNNNILYSKTNSKNQPINDWYIYANSVNRFVISTDNSSPIHGWISEDEILLNSEEKGNYIYNLKNKEVDLLTDNFYPPSYIVGEQGIIITHMPQKFQLDTSEVVAINIRTNEKIKLYGFPLDCIGSGGVNFELSKKE